MEQKNLNSLETQAIYLRLGQYKDIFSDFDIRPYSVRALSVDFLDEIKRASSGMGGDGVEIIFHIKERNEQIEETIKERLAAHFERHFKLLLNEKHKVVGMGLVMVLLGVVSMIAATLILFGDTTKDMLTSFLIVFLEPAAWFLLWEGMDQVIFNSKKINPELNFYRKMSRSHKHIHFRDTDISSADESYI